MPIQDALALKEKIINFIKFRGPSLPIHIARETQISTLFASAFLSELLSEKRLMISHLRVGNSPLYFTPGQEHLLENYSSHLRSKEKEAFALLKENKFLLDEKQEPAIRVALRAIKDFAFQFHYQGKLVWRYLTANEEEINQIKQFKEEIISQPVKILEVPQVQEIVPQKAPQEIKLEIFDKEVELEKIEPLVEETKQSIKETKEEPKKQKKKSKKKDDKFFNRVKEYLAKKKIEILDLEGFSKSEIRLKVNINGEENLLIAFNKKKIGDLEIIKAHKKAQEFKIPYTILLLGETPKKLNDLLNALKNLSEIGKIE